MQKKIISFILVILLTFSSCIISSAEAFDNLYRDIYSSNSNFVNLYNYALNQGFDSSYEFVCFSDTQYSYYFVFGDLSLNDSNLCVGSDVNFVRYYGTGSGYSVDYTYSKGTLESFTLDSDKMVVSSLDGLGSASDLHNSNNFYLDSTYLLIFVVALLFGIFLFTGKKGYKV